MEKRLYKLSYKLIKTVISRNKIYKISTIVLIYFFYSWQFAIADKPEKPKESNRENLSYSFTNSGKNENLVDNDILGTCDALKKHDGSNFDWSAIESDDNLEFCLIELAYNLKNIESMTAWLKNQGFSKVSTVSNNENHTYLNAIWIVTESQEQVPFYSSLPFFKRIFTSRKNYVVQVVYIDGVPETSTAHFNIL